MKHPKLNAEKRTTFGKKVKQLRKEGILPVNIFGKGIQSIAVQVPSDAFITLYKEVGQTGLVDVTIDGKSYPSLIQEIKIDPLHHTVLHANFHKVDLKEKIKTMISVVTIGEPKAVADKAGLLLQTLSEVEIEALPENLPEKIEADVTNLAAVDEHITVAELSLPANVTMITEGDQVVAKITELVSKEAAEQAAEEAAAAAEAKSEGEIPAEAVATEETAKEEETETS